jgi:glycosyltransferase involved in cell wall biosynthesis
MITQSQQMRSLCVALPFSLFGRNSDPERYSNQVEHLAAQPCVTRVLILHQNDGHEEIAQRISRTTGKLNLVEVDSWISGKAIMRILEATDADGLLLSLSEAVMDFERRSLEEFLAAAETSGAGLVYSDSRQIIGADVIERPRINYQLGSIGETFDFGPAVLISKRAAEEALSRHGPVRQDIRWGGFYDLRLKISIDFPVVRVAEALYAERVPLGQPPRTASGSSGKPFYIQDRSDKEYQIELEGIATNHLRRIGAYLESGNCPPPVSDNNFPVPVSIIIPTRNRERTITGAIQSALNQSTSFAYNVIVIDDHSTDRTGEIVQQFARQHKNVVHIIPEREDMGIGGLWNEAIYSQECGLYAVQLDSDDVYAHDHAVEILVNEFKRPGSDGADGAMNAPRYAMVVGSYTFVDFDLKEIPPGLNQRLELSRENGRNNVLCIEGPGAPRAFYVPVLRRFGFPNVSFGEDYAVALRIGREYDIGRVFESVYLARQWEGNTYRSLPLGSAKSINFKDIIPAGIDQQAFLHSMRPIIMLMKFTTANRNNAYKDYLRTVEIQARSNRNRYRG